MRVTQSLHERSEIADRLEWLALAVAAELGMAETGGVALPHKWNRRSLFGRTKFFLLRATIEVATLDGRGYVLGPERWRHPVSKDRPKGEKAVPKKKSDVKNKRRERKAARSAKANGGQL